MLINILGAIISLGLGLALLEGGISATPSGVVAVIAVALNLILCAMILMPGREKRLHIASTFWVGSALASTIALFLGGDAATWQAVTYILHFAFALLYSMPRAVPESV